MAIVKWTNVSHIAGLFNTLCGREIPTSGKEWNAFGTASCKACLKAEAIAIAQAEYDERNIIGQCPFNPKKTFTVHPINTNKFAIHQFISGAWQSETIADRYRTSEIAFIDQDKLKELAKR